MSERAINVATKKRLINNEPFAYAHLVKFERPHAMEVTGAASTDAIRYGYLSDAAFNISFDDGTSDVLGVSNGAQTYFADKVTAVGSYSESSDVKTTGITLKLSAESLYNTVTASMRITGTTITASTVNFVKEGFREGDKILVSNGGGSNTNREFKVTGIKTNGTVLTISAIDDAVSNMSSAASTTIKVVSDELKGPLVEMNNQDNLKSYHNREVFIYKVFLDPTDNSIIGAPYLVFKGLINSTTLTDKPSGNLEVTWSVTSHWGDFVQVNGRLTSDAIHRALDNDGYPQPEVARKEAYADDLGYAHSEDTISILATYKHSEDVEKQNVKSKWGGFRTKIKTYTETEITDREVDLNFSLQAKYIPIIYGIDKVKGRPVFVDTKSGDANNVYIAEVLCEGEIGGIYDVYIDGIPSICFNKEDFDDRNNTNGTSASEAAVVCRGRADIGQTIGGAVISGIGISGSSQQNFNLFPGDYSTGSQKTDGQQGKNVGNITSPVYYNPNRALLATTTTSDAKGAIDGQTLEFEVPNEVFMTVHSGKEDQRADDLLVGIAVSPGFKRQNDYYDPTKELYWSPNHRLLDTAYIVSNTTISQEATTLPEFEYVVRGKLVKCFNYDYSYQHVPNSTYGSGSEAHGNFKVGDTVTLYNTTGDGVLNADVFIIDKWSMVGPDGVEEYRFRYSNAPNLNYTDGIPAIKNFYMKNASNQTWHMNTSDHVFDSGTISTCLKVVTKATTSPATSAPTYTVVSQPGTEIVVNNVGTWYGLDDIMNMGYTDGQIAEHLDLGPQTKSFIVKATQPSGAGTDIILTQQNNVTGAGISSDQTVEIITRNQVKLASSASSVNDAYNGLEIELLAENTVTKNVTRQVRLIQDYVGADKLAIISIPWDGGNAPAEKANTTYTYKIFSRADMRVSINPALQLMDYMSSRTYGKSLDVDNDLAKSDWLLAGRVCDSRGTQTLSTESISATAGDRYVLTSTGASNGTILAMGRVKASVSSGTSLILEECFGSFTKEFMKNSHSYELGDIVYTTQGYFRCTSAGRYAAAPTVASHSGFSARLTSFPIHKITQTGSTNSKSTASTSTSINVTRFEDNDADTRVYRNPNTFSLYDMSFVKYWRYLGWEQHHQRWVTRHQTCGTVDTSASVLDTVSGFLQQMNGMLTFESGKYALKIATTTDTITSTKVTAANSSSGQTYEGYTPGSEANVRCITNDDIIGDISLKDKGVSKAFNTVTSQIEMPSTQWKGKTVSFYDSNMLKSDKMIIKSGSLTQASVINYFNARINVENFLKKSRFGMTINFTIGPKGLLLKAGETISITHEKFDWTNKVFRIKNINFMQNCNCTITAEEYDDSYYDVTAPRLPSILNEDFRSSIESVPGTPSNLTATAKAVGSIDLSWSNASGTTTTSETEIWVHTSNNAPPTNGGLLTTVKGTVTAFQHNVGADNAQRYYWIRHKKTLYNKGKQKAFFGAFHGSVNATTVIPSSLYDVILQANSQVFIADHEGTIVSPNEIAFNAQRHNLSGSVTFSSSPSVTLTGSGDTRALSKANMGSNTSAVITATVTSTTAERAAGADNTYTSNVTISRNNAGAPGATGTGGHSITLIPSKHIISYTQAGAESTSVTFTVDEAGSNSPQFSFETKETGESDYTERQAQSTTATFTLPDDREPDLTESTLVKVKLYEGGSSTVVAQDVVTIYAVQDGQDAITVVVTNESHTIPTDSSGNNGNFAGSGTDIKVFKGSTALAYNTGGNNNVFSVSAATSAITAGSASTVSTYTRRFANSSNMTADVASITFTITIYDTSGNTIALTKVQSFSKSKIGATGPGGSSGTSGKQIVTSYVYHQASASSQPSTPTASAYAFNNNAFSGLTNGWGINPPTFTAGNSNKYWYAYFRAEENSAGGGSSSGDNLVFTASQQGMGFTGLVTFTSNNLTDGSSTYNPATVLNAGSTTIDGGKLTTNTVTATQIAANTITAAQVAANTITAGQIAAGSIVLSGNLIGNGTLPASKGGTGLTSITTLTNSGITINADGTLGGAGSGQVTKAGVGLGNVDNDSTATVRAGVTKDNVGLSNVDNTSAADIRSGTTAANVGLGSVQNLSAASQVITGWNTTIEAGALKLGNSSGARIELNATDNAPYILISDG